MNNTTSREQGQELSSSPFSMKKILVPVDFSYYSRKALEYAVFYARTFGADLFLLNILEIPEFDFENLTLDPPRFEDYVQKKIHTKLTNLAHQFIPRDIKYTKLVEVGVPGQKIVELAREQEADLIIMSTHGHSTIDMRIFGSVAQKVIRSANCPVISLNIYDRTDDQIGEEKSLEDIDDLDNQDSDPDNGNNSNNSNHKPDNENNHPGGNADSHEHK